MFAIDTFSGSKVKVIGPYSVSTNCVIIEHECGKRQVQFKSMLKYL